MGQMGPVPTTAKQFCLLFLFLFLLNVKFCIAILPCVEDQHSAYTVTNPDPGLGFRILCSGDPICC